MWWRLITRVIVKFFQKNSADKKNLISKTSSRSRLLSQKVTVFYEPFDVSIKELHSEIGQAKASRLVCQIDRWRHIRWWNRRFINRKNGVRFNSCVTQLASTIGLSGPKRVLIVDFDYKFSSKPKNAPSESQALTPLWNLICQLLVILAPVLDYRK